MTRTPSFQHPDKFFIGGQWTDPSSSAMIDVLNSATEERFVSVAEAQSADVERAVAAARDAFDNGPWPRLTHAERASYLNALTAELQNRAEDLASTWTIESGVTYAASLPTTRQVNYLFAYYASLADSFTFVERHKLSSGKPGLLVHEAVGVVAAIVPWNGPHMLSVLKLAPGLLAGCTFVLKVSPEAPGAAYIFAEACQKVGLPAGVVNVVTADREVSEHLVRHSGIDKVAFTGSTAAGRRIASICGERIARYTLELGGKSAAVVLDDYDIDKVADELTGGTAFLTGQVCFALTRIIVPRSRHDDIVDALSTRFKGLSVGDPFHEGSHMGPLAMQRQRERVEHYIQQGKAGGAKLATGGGRPAHLDRGFYIEPTVFAYVENSSIIAQEEIFGPVLSVIPADDERQAVAIANDSIYGLNAAVFSDDPERAYRVARGFRSGVVMHNGLDMGAMEIGVGGFKQSGVGREGGVEGLRAYLETKSVVMAALPPSLAEAA